MASRADHRNVKAESSVVRGGMRVAFVSEHANPVAALGGPDAGGQNVHVGGLAIALASRGHDVCVYTRRADGDLPRRLSLRPGVVVEQVDAGPAAFVPRDGLLPHMEEFGRGLARAWRVMRPDVVHAHFWMSGVAALDAAGPLGIPTVQTFHALGVVKRRFHRDDPSPVSRVATERHLARTVDAVVATSVDELAELGSDGVTPRCARVIPCGVDTTSFRPEGPVERRGLPHRVVVVSRLVERKGVSDVLHALRWLPEVELVVAGGTDRDDSDARLLRDLARDLGVSARAEIRGPVDRDRLPALLRSASAVVCVPWYEPFGLVALEAMACGVPVVASAVGGLAETVVDGTTGLLVPPRSPEALALAVRRLLHDRRLQARFAREGRRRAQGRYDWHLVADRTETLYQGVLQRRRAHRHDASLPATGAAG